MHNLKRWEASRSGAGMTVTTTAPDGTIRKTHVRKIVAEGSTVRFFGANGELLLALGTR